MAVIWRPFVIFFLHLNYIQNLQHASFVYEIMSMTKFTSTGYNTLKAFKMNFLKYYLLYSKYAIIKGLYKSPYCCNCFHFYKIPVVHMIRDLFLRTKFFVMLILWPLIFANCTEILIHLPRCSPIPAVKSLFMRNCIKQTQQFIYSDCSYIHYLKIINKSP